MAAPGDTISYLRLASRGMTLVEILIAGDRVADDADWLAGD